MVGFLLGQVYVAALIDSFFFMEIMNHIVDKLHQVFTVFQERIFVSLVEYSETLSASLIRVFYKQLLRTLVLHILILCTVVLYQLFQTHLVLVGTTLALSLPLTGPEKSYNFSCSIG